LIKMFDFIKNFGIFELNMFKKIYLRLILFFEIIILNYLCICRYFEREIIFYR